jgi:ABC-2 type transport system permease protein
MRPRTGLSCYAAFIAYELRLSFRYRSGLLINYLVPVLVFVLFSEIFGARSHGQVTVFLSMALVIGALGNGLWGAGMRAVAERENNILRRFKVAPISPLPLLVGSLASGWLMFLPAVALLLLAAHFRYHMPFPSGWPWLVLVMSLGILALRSLGLIVAAVSNSTHETTLLLQLLYMPMLFLSGAAIPLAILPSWARTLGHFLPSFHLLQSCQAILDGKPALDSVLFGAVALLTTLILGTFLSRQLFRWDKDEKIRPAAKLCVLAVLIPVLGLGVYQVQRGDHGTAPPLPSWGSAPGGPTGR